MDNPKKKGSRKKNFVLDTNVILHDYECIDKFEENDIYLPIAVLEELDNFKKGSQQINYNARAFVRRLDELSDQDFFRKGASLGSDKGHLFVYTKGTPHRSVEESFSQRIPDHRILSAAMHIKDEQPEELTILVTKDVNLRMKAKSLGMKVEDYINDKVPTTDIFNAPHLEIEGIDGDIIDKIYESQGEIDLEDLNLPEQPKPNQGFVLKSDRNSVLVRYKPFTNTVVRVDKRAYLGITPRNAEQAFAMEVLADPDVKLVGLSGKAGTGKTLLALAASLSQVLNKDTSYRQILLARPIVALANKDLGFLPGDEKSKVAPYMQPLFDNLNVIKGVISPSEVAEIARMQKEETLIIEALAYIRGRSLNDAIVIIDEAQNLTPHEVKTIITRAGQGTKMIFTGDIEQIDSPYLDAQSNGLAYMINKMKGEKLFAHVNLIKGERSELSELASNLL
ncbi:MAG: PhoH family protein [Porphyromonas sp.]|nr:PhoH family protein [Porphyromonas sp.]